MKSRTAARELALIALSQIDITNKDSKYNLDEILLNSVRTLVNDAESELKIAVGALIEIKEFIDTYESDHQFNITRPIDEPDFPVPIPMTSDMTGRINCLIDVAEKSFRALETAEIAVLEENKSVHDYTKKIVKSIRENLETIDESIKECSIGWNVERLLHIDKNILRIALGELLYIDGTPVKVIIDEAVELSKKFSSEESSSFINGILGKVVESKKIKK
ncbi:MAG: transcription antitermination factor NusB [Candidatus Gastranaerophilaceae bacterium]